jgi:hypothetical protein
LNGPADDHGSRRGGHACAGVGAPALSAWLLALPFDALRAQYSSAVRLGMIRRSMLASRDFECLLGAMERGLLGPYARRV